MDKNQNKNEDRKITQRPIKDRGDLSKSLVSKVFEELDIMEVLHDRDRGDSKHPTRQFRNYNTIKPLSIHKTRKTVPANNKNDEVAARILSAAKKEIQNVTVIEPKDLRKEHSAKLTRKNLKEETKKAATKDVKIAMDDIEKSQANLAKVNNDKKKFGHVTKERNPLCLPRALDKVEPQNKSYLDLENRKRIRERYTVKLRNNQIWGRNVDNAKGNAINDDHDPNKKQIDDETDKSKPQDPSKGSVTTEPTKPTKKSKELTQVQRKPVVKTIRLSNDNRVYKDYKTVTFLEQKESTPLQIKIPNDCQDKRSVETNTVVSRIKSVGSNVSVRMQQLKKNRSLKTKSPLIASNYGHQTQTEVAKWAPSCISQHTKPYYEAWVDTKLTSTSKCSENERDHTKKLSILRTFKRALELKDGARSPDLIYEKVQDERYTGKITVRRSNAK